MSSCTKYLPEIRVPAKMFDSALNIAVGLLCFVSLTIHLFYFFEVYYNVIFTLKQVVVDNTFLLCTFSGLSIYYYVSSSFQTCLDTRTIFLLLRYAATTFLTLVMLAFWLMYESEDDVENLWKTSILEQGDAFKWHVIMIISTFAYLILMLACAVETIFLNSHDYAAGLKNGKSLKIS